MVLAATIVLLAGSAGAAPDETVHLTAVPKGAMAKIGYYAPNRATFSDKKPDAITKAPEGLKSPQYGTLPIGDGVAFIIDEPDGAPAKLYVDANHNGDLTDDPEVTWDGGSKSGNVKPAMYQGSAMIDIGDKSKPFLASVNMYRFDKDDPKRAQLKSTLLFYRDYAYEGEITLAGKAYKTILSDEHATGDFRGASHTATPNTEPTKPAGVNLLIDVNGNGKFDSRGESFDIAKPFNIGGTTYEVADMARDGSSFKVVKSSRTVDAVATPPDHGVGKSVTAFETVDTDKKAVKFPEDYKGKVVLLDFWATWCGPCMHEMPNVVKAYGKYHDKGFEILGVSLDNEQSIKTMPEVMQKNGMTWRQIADGKFWQAEIAQKYAIDSIPATFLVDGTTGKVIGANLRGEALDKAVAAALDKDKAATPTPAAAPAPAK